MNNHGDTPRYNGVNHSNKIGDTPRYNGVNHSNKIGDITPRYNHGDTPR
jgi:hypothetical protein